MWIIVYKERPGDLNVYAKCCDTEEEALEVLKVVDGPMRERACLYEATQRSFVVEAKLKP